MLEWTVLKNVKSPIAWLEAPEWLTPEQAAELTGRTVEAVQELIDIDAVDLMEDGDGYLIEKRSLREFQETLALVLHWDD